MPWLIQCIDRFHHRSQFCCSCCAHVSHFIRPSLCKNGTIDLATQILTLWYRREMKGNGVWGHFYSQLRPNAEPQYVMQGKCLSNHRQGNRSTATSADRNHHNRPNGLKFIGWMPNRPERQFGGRKKTPTRHQPPSHMHLRRWRNQQSKTLVPCLAHRRARKANTTFENPSKSLP